MKKTQKLAGVIFGFLVLCTAGLAQAQVGKGDNGSFNDFINNQVTTPTTTSTENDFESYINFSTGKGESNTGVTNVNTTLPSDIYGTNTNLGGSIYVPYEGPVFTGPGLEGGALLAENLLDDNVSKERDIKELIIGWTNFLLSVAALVAVVALVWAGFLYITAAGDDGRMETAKKIVIWVVVGILLILAAYAIVNTVMQSAF